MGSTEQARLAQHGSEAVSEYAGIEHADLIDMFYETDGSDLKIGRELSARLLRHAGFAVDPTEVPLTGRDGQIYDQETSHPLTLADYVNYAAAHHIEALDSILGFLEMKPGEEAYEINRVVMLRRVNTGRG